MVTNEKDVFNFFVQKLECGWCDVVIVINGKEISFCASYIGENPLASLIDACASLKDKFDEYEIFWEAEPGRMKIDMKLDEKGMLLFDIVRVDDESNEEKWSEIVPFDLVVNAITSEGFRILNSYGLYGYRCSWQADIDFPLANLLNISGECDEMYRQNDRCTDVLKEIQVLQRHINRDNTIMCPRKPDRIA